MTDITDQRAEQMRQQLAAHEAKKAEEAAAIQAAANAEALAAIQPAVVLIDEGFEPRLEAMRQASQTIGATDWDMTTLINNCVTCLAALQNRIERKVEQLTPVVPAELPVETPPAE